MKIEELQSYEVVEKRFVADVNSEGYLLKHKKTGARILLLSNDDDNKVFSIGFRTTPVNSTGVAHILEHSVLCGSDKYPIKDPFVELAKGSLNTFLNAMTFPDKTIYPVASCNDKDFQNLMDVYLDAVFYPRIYKEDKIFRQEGWHYEMEDKDSPLTINGVVYNEMKGAFSSPDDVLSRELFTSLYPDTTYGFESGGDPEVIPELSYEEFLDFHRKYYHPTNSYIYLYGNMDMVEKLEYMDKEYLSKFERREINSEVETQKAFDKMRRVVKEYPIGEEEKESGNTYFSYNISISDSLDKEVCLALQILDYALCTAPGAPLKKALTEAGIGTEIQSSYDCGIKQPFFSVIAKNADTDKETAFVEIIEKVLTDIVKNGFDKKALLAGLNYFEFRYRESDYGYYPKGLMYGINILETWLYDEKKPFIRVESGEVYEALREKVEDGYFEKLIQTYMLDNPHKSMVVLLPKKGLTQEREKALAEELASYKAGLTDSEMDAIVEGAKALKAYQEKPDAEEDLAKIPLLSRKDMKKEANRFVNELRKAGDNDFLYHDLFTNGISYLRLIFKLDKVPARLIPYVGIMTSVLGMMDTDKHEYADLNNDINILTGGIQTISNVYGDIQDENRFLMTLEMKTKVMEQNLQTAIDLMKEEILGTNFADKKRLKEILAELKSRLQAQAMSASHVIAFNRALSNVSKKAAANEQLSGMDFYRLVEKLDGEFDAEADKLIASLKELAEIAFRPENLMLDLTGSEKAAEELPAMVEHFKKELYTCEVETGSYDPVLTKVKEGYKTPGQVQYVCRAGNFKHKGLPYTGSLRVLKTMMGYDYLWNQIRVKGGAYGCMCGFSKSGECFIVSYRDPNLKNTVEVYENAADYIAAFEADERMLTQYIIGAIGELDTPKSASLKGLDSLVAYMTGLTDADMQRERDELLATDAEALKKTSEQIRAFMEEDCLCVVGNADKITEAADLFDKVENLIR